MVKFRSKIKLKLYTFKNNEILSFLWLNEAQGVYIYKP